MTIESKISQPPKDSEVFWPSLISVTIGTKSVSEVACDQNIRNRLFWKYSGLFGLIGLPIILQMVSKGTNRMKHW